MKPSDPVRHLEARGWKPQPTVGRDRRWLDPERGDVVNTTMAIARQSGRDAAAKIAAEQKAGTR